MKALSNQDILMVNGGAKRSTVVKSLVRIVGRNLLIGVAVGSGVGTILAAGFVIGEVIYHYRTTSK